MTNCTQQNKQQNNTKQNLLKQTYQAKFMKPKQTNVILTKQT